ncbi:hypothetical protein GCM10018965_034870 [Nonomuraea roseola]
MEAIAPAPPVTWTGPTEPSPLSVATSRAAGYVGRVHRVELAVGGHLAPPVTWTGSTESSSPSVVTSRAADYVGRGLADGK